MDQNYDSSLEELSAEELRMLASMKRQEPQGEEHVGGGGKPSCVQNSAKASSAIDSAAGKMKMEVCSSSSSSSVYSSDPEEGSHEPQNSTNQRRRQHHRLKKQQQQFSRGRNPNLGNASTDSTNSHQSAYNTLIIHQNNSSLLADTWIPATHEFTSYGIGNRRREDGDDDAQAIQPNRPAHSYSNPYENLAIDESGNNNSTLTSSELSEIPRDYLNQLTVLKHLAKEVKQDPISGTGSSLLRSASFSKSQPDLTQTGTPRVQPKVDESTKSQPLASSRKSKRQNNGSSVGNCQNTAESASQSLQSQNQAMPQSQQRLQPLQSDDVLPSVQILEILMRENAALNAELVNARRKIATIHKLESELDKLQASHEALFASAERRESLERTARAKLNTELKRLTAVNRELLSSGSLQNLSPSPYAASSADIEMLKKEIAKRDFTIAQLLSQNKELVAVKERQDIELCAQRATLAEQRTHIDILDSALTNAQGNVLRLEEECRKKQELVDKSSQLKRALSSLQLTQDKREQSEKKVRSALEGEISDLKLRLASLNVSVPGTSNLAPQYNAPQSRPAQSQRSYQSPPYTPPKYESNSNLTENQLQLLQEKLKVSEEQIYHLNSQVAKWENVFAPPTTSGSPAYKTQQQPIRGGAPCSSTPDTPNSWTNSNSRGGTPHFFGGGASEKVSMEELHHGGAGGRGNELEWKLKELETRLMEKDAMIRILQSPTPTYGGGSMLNSSSGGLTYRDSPGYSQASTMAMSPSPCHGMHPTSVSLGMTSDPSASLMYSKLGGGSQQKCDSEPPSYANLPLKLRLGGSGSSLVKNSNESLTLGGGSGSNTGGNSPNISSGQGSMSSVTGVKSIEEQLKDLDNQMLSKDGVGGGGGGAGGSGGGVSGSLKMQSGLCCIPGFPHPGPSARKGKVSGSLLESIAVGTVILPSVASGFRKAGSILPPKPPNPGGQPPDGGSRTSSGPPFLSPSDQSPTLRPLVTTTTAMSLSNSVDSVLSADPPNGASAKVGSPVVPGGDGSVYVFAPAVGLKGLPPKPTQADTQAGKSRSLERNKYVQGELSGGKYTALYDSSRCRSLDRRELKLSSAGAVSKPEEPKVEEKKEKNLKSSVSSKAAFFGQLLTRRSPSPGRDKEKKEKSEGSTPKLGRRFPFGKVQQPAPNPASSNGSTGDVAEERMMLDKQGRQSQRNRISSKWSSCNTLEAVEEQSGSESPWTTRKKGSSPKVSKKVTKDKDACRGDDADSASKKWGRIVKTPFGLRYTFGSPRVAAPLEVAPSKQEK